MKITSLPRYKRNAVRFEQIVRILAKYGLADWLESIDREFLRKLLVRNGGEAFQAMSRAERVRMALTELGTTFIKLGQMLSTRADLVGPDLARELTKLQTDTPPDAPEIVWETIELDLGRPVDELFVHFEDKPVASASIAQAHRATLPDGEAVIVKVRHRGIVEKVNNDLDILAALASLASQYSSEISLYQPVAVIAEFRRNLLAELDFIREEQNLLRAAGNFADDPAVHIPKPFPSHSGHKVLTMELLEGIPIAETEKLDEQQIDRVELARRGANMYLDMIFRDRFYHADPHPGNILILPEGVIGLLDFGMTGTLDDNTRECFEGLIRGFLLHDGEMLAEYALKLGHAPSDLDRERFAADLENLVAAHLTGSLKSLDLSSALDGLVDLIRRHRVIQKPGIALLIKVLIMLEGTSRLLDADFSLAELLEPYYRQMMRRRLSPRNLFRRVQRTYHDWDRFFHTLPRDLGDIIERVRKGTLDVHLAHHRLDPIINRLAHGMLTAAILVGSAQMLASAVPPTIRGLSVLGLLGVVLGLWLAFHLLRAIRKSGGLVSPKPKPGREP